MLSKRHNSGSLGSVIALLTAVISVAVAAFLLINRQAVIDQVSVWQYHPSPQIQALASRSGMGSTGKFYFYASQPSLDDRQAFAGHCPNPDATTSVLGCYAGQRIYVFDVTNAQLAGIRSVTAAHEMLHAAYERLTTSERDHVNAMVEAEYDKLKSDKALATIMAFYAKTEPGQRDNELHSVIGTEVANLNPDLENYYKQYFNDRQKVVNLYNSYQGVFEQLQTKADQLNKQLTSLAASIKQESDAYNSEVAQLNADIRSFNQQADSGGFNDRNQFDQRRAALVSRVSQLNALRDKINGDIATFDSLQNELASIASQNDQLNRSINSSLAPAPKL